MRTKLIYLAVVAMLATTLSVALLASTSGTGDDTEAAAELQDLQSVALEMDITLDEATDRYGWNADFAQMISDFRSSYSGDLTMAEITGDAEAWVGFAGTPPSGANTAIEEFRTNHSGVSVFVQSGLGFTEQEVESAVAGAYYAVLVSPSVLEAVSSFDHGARRIDVVVRTEGVPPGPVVDGLRQDAERGAADATRPDIMSVISVSVEAVTHQIGFENSSTKHHGGETLKLYGRNECTSGFGTINSSGTRGIATAGHCGDELTDDGQSLTHEREHVGAYGDFQWHTGVGTEGNDFYFGEDYASETY